MRKQLDPRIPTLINNGVKRNHRSFIVLVGDKGRDQVSLRLRDPKFHQLLTVSCTLDCEPSLSTLASPRVRTTVCAVVLQEGTRFQQVSRPIFLLHEPRPTDTRFPLLRQSP